MEIFTQEKDIQTTEMWWEPTSFLTGTDTLHFLGHLLAGWNPYIDKPVCVNILQTYL